MTRFELKVQFKELHWSKRWTAASRFGRNLRGKQYRESFDAYCKHIMLAKIHEASKLADVAVSRNPNAKSVAELRSLISDIRLLTDI